jgi:Domain of unknown function (DUF1816)
MNLTQSPDRKLTSMSWWLEVFTTQPWCTYYFGPFESLQEAALAEDGYIEDLVTEDAGRVTAQIIWGNPKELTICFDEN